MNLEKLRKSIPNISTKNLYLVELFRYEANNDKLSNTKTNRIFTLANEDLYEYYDAFTDRRYYPYSIFLEDNQIYVEIISKIETKSSEISYNDAQLILKEEVKKLKK